MCLKALALLFFFLSLSSSSLALNAEVLSVPVGTRTVPIEVPRSGIQPSELGVIVNTADSQSVDVANYYKQKYGLSDSQIINVNFDPTKLDITTFSNSIRPLIISQTAANIQAYAVTWTSPWIVGCMSITSAISLGYDPKYCHADALTVGCQTTATVNYPAASTAPFTDLNFRPSMMIGAYRLDPVSKTLDVAQTLQDAHNLIDRGFASQALMPQGDGYLLKTSDANRSVRAPDFSNTVTKWNGPNTLKMNYWDFALKDPAGYNYYYLGYNSIKSNILFYELGALWVDYVQGYQGQPTQNVLSFVPGAVADHLTSYGGVLDGSWGQMSALAFLQIQNGATGTYGTVVEPCAYQEKFPRASLLVPAYFSGNTLVEAYWKSVSMPGEGIFVGDPLARPFKNKVTYLGNGTLQLDTSTLNPGKTYELQGAMNGGSPQPLVSGIQIASPMRKTIIFNDTFDSYKLVQTASATPLTLTQPAPGNKLTIGVSPLFVKWSYSGVQPPCSTLSVDLLKSGARVMNLSSSEPIGSGGQGGNMYPTAGVSSTGDDYYVQISCVGNSSIAAQNSSPFSFTAPPAPTAPGNLSAAQILSTSKTKGTTTASVKLSWSASSSSILSGYNVFRAAGTSNGPSTYSKISTVAGTSTSYTDQSLFTNNTRYYYQVQAVDSLGQVSTYSNVGTISPNLPKQPTLSATRITSTSAPTYVQLSATSVAVSPNTITRYNLYRNSGLLISITGSSVSYQDKAVSPGVTYEYQIESVDSAGQTSPKSNLIRITP